MKPIILASNSPQRKNLLKVLGLKFSVQPSQARESKQIKTTCANLVKANALLKASDIARRLKKGVVIGADTVIYLGKGQILGKPRDLKHAKRQLKTLSAKPQWVYTGIAVIDVESQRTVVDYEKTKVYMHTLNDEEIDRYHKKVPPFDKAGGFDIEGLGGAFIHRIEGCYSNVIGLPLAKLTKMLKKVGVFALSLLAVFYVSGCTSEYNLATKKQESYLYSMDHEVELGSKVAAKIEEKYKLVGDVDANERVQNILARIVSVSDRKDIVYFIKIIDDDEVINAASLPGGYIYLFSGLMAKIKSEDQLAAIIAHEMGHITARHGIKSLQNSYAAILLQLAAVETDSQLATGVSATLATIFMNNSLDAEFEADRLSVKYLQKAGYDPHGMVEFLEELRREQEKGPTRSFSYWRTHPHLAKRVSAANQEISGRLEFKDYLNLTGDNR